MHCRRAAVADAQVLAEMNQQLIRDEGHRNPMNLDELIERMRGWLLGEYEAVLFETTTESLDREVVGYALYRRETDYVYLRQFFVRGDRRRGGIGRAAIDALCKSEWRDCPRVRLEVLTGNAAGIAFWRAVGFGEYCLTLERSL